MWSWFFLSALTRYTSKIPNKNEGLWKLFSFSRTLNLLNNIILKKDQFSTQTCNLHFTIAFCSKRLVYDLWWEIAHTKSSSLALGNHKTYQIKNIPRQYIHLIWHNVAFKFIRQETCLNYRSKKNVLSLEYSWFNWLIKLLHLEFQM